MVGGEKKSKARIHVLLQFERWGSLADNCPGKTGNPSCKLPAQEGRREAETAFCGVVKGKSVLKRINFPEVASPGQRGVSRPTVALFGK